MWDLFADIILIAVVGLEAILDQFQGNAEVEQDIVLLGAAQIPRTIAA